MIILPAKLILPKLYCIFFLILVSCTTGPKDQSGSITQRNNDIAKVELKELSNETLDLKQFSGKTVFINFWATWCKPCIQEMPTIANVQESLKNENVVFLMASNEEPDQIEKFKERHPYNFHYVRIENLEALKIQALPTTFIFNPEGKLKFSENGFRIWDDPSNVELITKIMNDHEK